MGKSVREIYQELTQYNENLKQDRCENRKIGDDDSGGGDSKLMCIMITILGAI